MAKVGQFFQIVKPFITPFIPKTRHLSQSNARYPRKLESNERHYTFAHEIMLKNYQVSSKHYKIMIAKILIGIIFVVASLLKLATLAGLIHLSWFEHMSGNPWADYFAPLLILYVGTVEIIEGIRHDSDHYSQQPDSLPEDGKMPYCTIKSRKSNKYTIAKIIIGLLFVIASLLKIATMMNLIHLSWFERIPDNPLGAYFTPILILLIGIGLVIDAIKNNRGQWLQRSVPLHKESKRMHCKVSFGGDEYIFMGEPFHGARLEAYFGGIRMDLCHAEITEDEEIDINTFMGSIELIIPLDINVTVKSRSFIGGVKNETDKYVKPSAHSLHIIASNLFGTVKIRNIDSTKAEKNTNNL